MKRNSLLTLLILLSGFFGSIWKAKAQINPAPTNGEHISIGIIQKGIFFLNIIAEPNNAWIDFNGNDNYDSGEELSGIKYIDFSEYTSSEFTIYGKITRFDFIANFLSFSPCSSLDLSNCTSLIFLNVTNSYLADLDLSNNKGLMTLDCSHNFIGSLDLSNNKELTDLNCSSNQLSDLDLSENKKLRALKCFPNQLRSLDLSNNKELITLDCSYNFLESLNLLNNEKLTTLNCSSNELKSIDLSNNKELTNLNCSSNQLTSLNLSNNKELRILNNFSNQLTNLDLSNNKELTDLNCSSNQLTSLNLTNKSKLTNIDCSSNQLRNLDLSALQALKSLFCQNNQINNLKVYSNKKLEVLYIYRNKIQEAPMRQLVENLPALNIEEAINNLSNNTYFSDLAVIDSKDENEQNVFPLDLLPIAKNKGWVPKDWGLNKDGNGNTTFNDNTIGTAVHEVTSEYIDFLPLNNSPRIGIFGENLWIDLNSNGKYDNGESLRSSFGGMLDLSLLGKHRIYGKNITRIRTSQAGHFDLTHLKNLRAFTCEYNWTDKTFNLKENKELRILSLEGSWAAQSIKTDCPKLHYINLENTQIRPDFSPYPELKTVHISSMDLTNLDLSKNPKLTYLDCSYNKLTGLDLSHNSMLTYLDCSNNLINGTAMQALVESLPTITIQEEPGKFIPVNPDGDDNVCTPDQIAIAKAKNWNVQTPLGEPFIGTSLEEIIPNEVAGYNIKVWAQDGILYLSGLEPGMPVQVYALSGTMIHSTTASGESLEIPLSRTAIYVLRVGQYVIKAMIP